MHFPLFKKFALFSATAAMASLVGFSLLPEKSEAVEESINTRMQVEEIVREFISKNPQVIIDSLNKFQQTQMEEQARNAAMNLTAKQDELFKDADAPFAGNPDGDLVIAEFFDYHCGYCKKTLPMVTDLIKEDKKVKIIFKEFPILSPDSEKAAKAALAVWRIQKDKYFDFHAALMKASGQYSDKVLEDIAKSVGVDAGKMKAEMESEAVRDILAKNKKLAADIGVNGTPAFVMGTRLIPGALSLEEMKAIIKDQRGQ